MINLVPMAGSGERFSKEGYGDPKPLIDVSGKPMILQAANSLPVADKWIFICREEQVKEYDIDKILRKRFPESEVISINYLTDGQASTCLLAESYLSDQESLLIGACDNGMIWDTGKYDSIVASEEVDACIWTFRNNVTVKRNPRMYGWVVVDKDENATKVSCKIPISSNPVRDHAIIGTFYFRRSINFFNAVRKMIARNRRINNEFYIDEAMNELIEEGLKVKVFEVNKYICWGTPNDLRTYRYWEQYFRKTLQNEK
jgi:dTDP-glucose pyrophosphorylase